MFRKETNCVFAYVYVLLFKLCERYVFICVLVDSQFYVLECCQGPLSLNHKTCQKMIKLTLDT